MELRHTRRRRWPSGPLYLSTILESAFALWAKRFKVCFYLPFMVALYRTGDVQSIYPTQDSGPRSAEDRESSFASILAAQMRKRDALKKDWFRLSRGFCITAPAQRSATGLPFIQPCSISIQLKELLHFKNYYISRITTFRLENYYIQIFTQYFHSISNSMYSKIVWNFKHCLQETQKQ